MAEPAWPPIEAQLAHDQVPSGSALERLIRDNQDFRLLRPEEANDRIGVPLWLRVYWRKQHPDREYRADDPTGGYPRVLKDLYAWMLANPELPAGSDPSAPPSGRKAEA
jgi:hypothetical protein